MLQVFQHKKLLALIIITLPAWTLSWNLILSSHFKIELLIRLSNLCLMFALSFFAIFIYDQIANRILKTVFLALFTIYVGLTTTMQFFHITLFDALLNESALDAIFSTSTGEAVEFVNLFGWRNLAFVVGFWLVVVCLFAGCIAPSTATGRKTNIAALTIALILALPTFIIAAYYGATNQKLTFRTALGKIVDSEMITGSTVLYGKYRIEKAKLNTALAQRSSIKAPISKKPTTAHTLVLVIGESAVRDHHGLYDYPLDTTPFLSSIRPSITLIKNAISPATVTQESIVRILTPANNESMQLWAASPSVVNMASAAGYETHWLSNQGHLGPFDTNVSVLAKESDIFKTINTSFNNISDDMKLYPLFNNAVSSPDAAEQQLIVLHLMGSHYNYEKRFPAEETVFYATDYANRLPMENKSTKFINKIANYDNSIRYTDKLLGKIIGRLEQLQKESTLIYFSDHGEVLDSTSAILGHGSPDVRPEHVEVPLLLWRNGTSHPINPGEIETEFGTEDIFHVLLHALNIESELYDKTHDILSDSYLDNGTLVLTPEGKLISYSDISYNR